MWTASRQWTTNPSYKVESFANFIRARPILFNRQIAEKLNGIHIFLICFLVNKKMLPRHQKCLYDMFTNIFLPNIAAKLSYNYTFVNTAFIMYRIVETKETLKKIYPESIIFPIPYFFIVLNS